MLCSDRLLGKKNQFIKEKTRVSHDSQKWFLSLIPESQEALLLTVRHVRLLDAPVVGDVLALGLLPLQVQPRLLVVVAAVLVHDALGSLHVLFSSFLLPPILQVPCFT